MLHTTQKINEAWTTGSRSEIVLTATVEIHDFDWTINYTLTINGKEADPYMIKEHGGKHVLICTLNRQKTGVVISDAIKAKIDNMIANAKVELKPRVAEWNEVESANRRA